MTSFSGLLIFQLFFKRINLKQRLKKCFSHLKVSPIFGYHLVVMLLVVHLPLGFRRLRDVDYYRDDPIVLRLMGLRKIPDVSTISRTLSKMEAKDIKNLRTLSRTLVIEGLQRERLPRLTLDFDGSVQSSEDSSRIAGGVLTAMIAHNLSREIQMLTCLSASRARAKRPTVWKFEKLDTMRHRIIQRAGRLTRPQGELTLTMSANRAVRKDLLHFLDVLQKAA